MPQLPVVSVGAPPTAVAAQASKEASDPKVVPAREDGPEAPGPKGRQRDAEVDRAEGKKYRLFEGTVLETVLTNRLDGSSPAP